MVDKTNNIPDENFMKIVTKDNKLKAYITDLFMEKFDSENVKKFNDPNYMISDLQINFDFGEKYSLRQGMETLGASVINSPLISFLIALDYFSVIRKMLKKDSISAKTFTEVKGEEITYMRRSNFKDEYSYSSFRFKDYFPSHLLTNKHSLNEMSNKEKLDPAIVKANSYLIELSKSDKAVCGEVEFETSYNKEFDDHKRIPVFSDKNCSKKRIIELYEQSHGITKKVEKVEDKKPSYEFKSLKQKVQKTEKQVSKTEILEIMEMPKIEKLEIKERPAPLTFSEKLELKEKYVPKKEKWEMKDKHVPKPKS